MIKLISGFFIYILLLSFHAKAQDLTWNEARDAYDQLPAELLFSFNTQCGDRAHVWSYLLKTKFNIDSQKVFLYFTPKSFNYTGMLWGFHVATSINVEGEEFIIEKIPRYEILNGRVVLHDDLLFDRPIAIQDWLKAHTGFDSCKELDMNNPAHKQAFKPFGSIKVYKSADNCVIAKTPAAYWWPNSVHRAIYKNARLINPHVDQNSAQLACSNIFPRTVSTDVIQSCKELLRP